MPHVSCTLLGSASILKLAMIQLPSMHVGFQFSRFVLQEPGRTVSRVATDPSGGGPAASMLQLLASNP